MMQDKNKTKEQLINELAEIRRQVVELEKSLTEPRQTAEALHKSEAILRSVFKATPVGIAVMKDR
ncbi:MAG: hypothetical protein ABRQ30_05360, partial [Smithellaceae bacterium]